MRDVEILLIPAIVRFLKDGVDLDDKSSHYHDRAESQTQESEAVLLIIQRHQDETNNEGNDADDHPLVVLTAKRKVIFHCYSLIKVVQRHFQIFSDGKPGTHT